MAKAFLQQPSDAATAANPVNASALELRIYARLCKHWSRADDRDRLKPFARPSQARMPTRIDGDWRGDWGKYTAGNP